MEWVVLFIVSWIVFFLLVRWKEFKKNFWGGILAVILQMLVDSSAISRGLYSIDKKVTDVMGSSLFFIIGPVFVIGVLLAQYHPRSRFLTAVSVIALTALYSAQEALLLSRGALVYTNWSFFSSVVVNLSAMIILSWFSVVILRKGMGSGRY